MEENPLMQRQEESPLLDPVQGTPKAAASARHRESAFEGALEALEDAAHGARRLVGLHDGIDEKPALVHVSLALLAFFLAYSLFYGMYEMNYHFTSTVFLMVETLTTVGYGNLVPDDDYQRGIAIIYM